MTDSAKLDALIKIRDGIIELIDTYKPAGVQDDIPDLSTIIWKATTGPRGAFEVAERQANENNASFTSLAEYLNRHSGKATISAYFVWKFTDSSGSVGRKPKS
jgi:hypothetical protein